MEGNSKRRRSRCQNRTAGCKQADRKQRERQREASGNRLVFDRQDSRSVDGSAQRNERCCGQTQQNVQAGGSRQQKESKYAEAAEDELLRLKNALKAEAGEPAKAERHLIVDGERDVRANRHRISSEDAGVLNVFEDRDIDLRIGLKNRMTGEPDEAEDCEQRDATRRQHLARTAGR